MHGFPEDSLEDLFFLRGEKVKSRTFFIYRIDNIHCEKKSLDLVQTELIYLLHPFEFPIADDLGIKHNSFKDTIYCSNK